MDDVRFPPNTYRGRALTFCYGYTSKGNEKIDVLCEIVQEGWEGQQITWTGYFTPSTEQRTLESLRHMGWEGDDLLELHGIGTKEVDLVIDTEEYNGKRYSRVQWVNAPGISLAGAMSPDAQKAFAARMRAKVLGSAKPAGSSGSSGSSGGGERALKAAAGGGKVPF
jgi:hypothetical protein